MCRIHLILDNNNKKKKKKIIKQYVVCILQRELGRQILKFTMRIKLNKIETSAKIN